MGAYAVRLADAIRPPNLRVGKTEKEVVLTNSDGNQENYVPPIVCPGDTSLHLHSALRRMNSAPKCTYMRSEVITHSKERKGQI